MSRRNYRIPCPGLYLLKLLWRQLVTFSDDKIWYVGITLVCGHNFLESQPSKAFELSANKNIHSGSVKPSTVWCKSYLNIVVLTGKVGGFDEVDWNITTPDSPPCLGWVLILQTDRELSIGLEQVPRPTSGKMLGVLSSSSDHVLRFSIWRPMQCCLFDLKTYIRSCFRSSRGRVLVNIWWPTWSPFSCSTLSSLSSQSSSISYAAQCA